MAQAQKDAEQMIAEAKGKYLIEQLDGGAIRLTIYGKNAYGGTGQVAVSLELSAANMKQFEKVLAGEERLKLKMPGSSKGAFEALSPKGLADALMREKEFTGDLYLGNLIAKEFRRECGYKTAVSEDAGMARLFSSGVMLNAVNGLTALFESMEIKQTPKPEEERIVQGERFTITLANNIATIRFDCDETMKTALGCESFSIRLTDFQMSNFFTNPDKTVLAEIKKLLGKMWEHSRDFGSEELEIAGKKLLSKLESGSQGIHTISNATIALKSLVGEEQKLAQK